MHESNEMMPLGLKILAHWKLHRPQMVASLVRENRLEQAVFTAQELTTELLHELAVVKKMDTRSPGRWRRVSGRSCRTRTISPNFHSIR
jgi:hypothetical protein